MGDVVFHWCVCPKCGATLETAIGRPLTGMRCRKHPTVEPVRHERVAQTVEGKVVRVKKRRRPW